MYQSIKIYFVPLIYLQLAVDPFKICVPPTVIYDQLLESLFLERDYRGSSKSNILNPVPFSVFCVLLAYRSGVGIFFKPKTHISYCGPVGDQHVEK
jgi:hypothetical protein